MWPCRVEEKMTLKEVDGQMVEEIETKIIAKDGTITRVPGQFQGYETSKEEPVEQPRRHDMYGFMDHPQLQQGNIMNEFAPRRLPQPKGNMNGWLIEDEEEVERNEVDSDLESTASSKPMWKKTNKADHDRASHNCPWCSKRSRCDIEIKDVKQMSRSDIDRDDETLNGRCDIEINDVKQMSRCDIDIDDETLNGDGEKRYTLHPRGAIIRDTIVSGTEVIIKMGNALPLSAV
ncbi:hypothetical protein Tco_0444539 [Tanacetum coccineum]